MVALGFILTVGGDPKRSLWLLYFLSGLLMFASPFFTSGRAAILPTIANREELHTANSITQTTGWVTLTIGTFAGGTSVAAAGYKTAFVLNALSFLFSAISIAQSRWLSITAPSPRPCAGHAAMPPARSTRSPCFPTDPSGGR